MEKNEKKALSKRKENIKDKKLIFFDKRKITFKNKKS